MSNLGFKTLTFENWLEPESVMSIFVTLSFDDGSTTPISADGWIDRIRRPQLDPNVPVEILKLFEVARGSMAYGYFFYPLYTLAGEQLYRVAETAASAKCKLLGAKSRKVKSFEDKIAFLQQQNVISQQDWIWWDSIRHLRNFASHPEGQSILMPYDVLSTLAGVAKHVNELFA
jgi:hypothetical protein